MNPMRNLKAILLFVFHASLVTTFFIVNN